MTPRPNCAASQFGCSCGNGPCKDEPKAIDLGLFTKTQPPLFTPTLKDGIAVIAFGIAMGLIVFGTMAALNLETQYRLEARI